MGRLITIEQYLNALSERTIDNTRQLKRSVEQRRNGMEDLYGICFSANGDSSHPAKFYISLSPDYVYLQRFAFKLVLRPFTSSVAGVSGGGSLTIDSTSLTANADTESIISGTSTLDETGGSITPNPHTHTASGSIGGLSYGIKEISSTADEWSMWIDGVPITDYLCEQQGVDSLFDEGEGIYPKNASSLDIEDMYDILDVASVMIAEGEDENAEKILRSGFKPVEIYGNKPFGIDAYLYVKYGNLNR